MKNIIHRIITFINFFVKAKTVYGIDSPVLYEFFRSVLDDKRNYYAFADIRNLRNRLKTDFTKIKRKDYGTGTSNKEITVAEILRTSAASEEKSALLFRIVKWFSPDKIIELGSNLGISTASMSFANRNTTVISIEGDPALASIAEANLNSLNLNYAEIICGTFEEKLSSVLNQHADANFFYIDGNHASKPTLYYTDEILKNKPQRFMIVYDDIYWSADMTKAWAEIQENQNFNLIIDLYDIGIAAYLPELREPVKKSLIKTSRKFWQAGFFR